MREITLVSIRSFIQLGNWWSDINHSPVWQDRISHTLAVMYAFIAIATLVMLLSFLFFLLLLCWAKSFGRFLRFREMKSLSVWECLLQYFVPCYCSCLLLMGECLFYRIYVDKISSVCVTKMSRGITYFLFVGFLLFVDPTYSNRMQSSRIRLDYSEGV